MSNYNDPSPRINPRVRAYGKARLDIARRAQTRQDWDALWKKPQHAFPFTWGEHWKQCIEYRVADYAAEVGFFIDVLGLPVNAFNEFTAMFTSPAHEFYFAVTPTFEGQEPTPPDALRLQFLVAGIFQVAQELESRGIQFEQPPQPVSTGSNYYVGYFRTPHGICIDLCGLVDQPDEAAVESQPEQMTGLGAPAAERAAPLPQTNPERYAPLGDDPDDVFLEVLDQPSRPSEPTYEPLDDSASAQPPAQPSAQPPVKPRIYRAIPFTNERQ